SVRLALEADGDGLPANGLTQADSGALQPVEFVHRFPGPAAKFHGDGLVCGDIWAPLREAAFTCSLWVRPSSQGALVSRMDCLDHWRGFDISLLADCKLSVHLIHAWPNNAIKVISKQPVDTQRWSHCVVTYDGSSRAEGVRCYIDGRELELEVEANSLTDTI